MIRGISGAAAVFIGWLALAGASPLQAQEDSVRPIPAPGSSIPFSLAISGGISLGSYEAGLNWALVKYLKTRRGEILASQPGRIYPELMSAGGASAGSINALISALSWCIDDDKLVSNQNLDDFNKRLGSGDRIDDNLFRFLWINVGIDELLPADRLVYRGTDALLTRTAFDRAINQIRRALKADIYRPDCSVPLGITVTRVDPVRMSIAGVEVENQRFIIPVRLQAAAQGGIEFDWHLVNRDDPTLGNIMYLRRAQTTDDGRYVIDHEDLIDAILASSAYPLAFGNIELSYCADLEANDGIAKAHECPQGLQPRIGAFIDGGVFDNIPLGAAMALAEPRPNDILTRERWLQSARPYSYIYVDPDTRRALGAKAGADPAARPQRSERTDFFDAGIRSHLNFLSGAVSTGRNYELYNVLRSGDWNLHSYDSICRLLSDMGIDSGGERQCETEIVTDPELCAALMQKLDAREEIGASEHRSAAACLLRDRQALEEIYYDYAGIRLAAGEITRLREDFLRRLQRLAQQSGHQQFALSVENMKRDKLGDRRILLTTRFAPITGKMLGAFGAFIDRPFRDYDYYAGVYDAVIGLADFRCSRHPDYEFCLARQTRFVYEILEIGAAADANTVFYLLATLEHDEFAEPSSPWHWLTEAVYFADEPRAGNMVTIFTALAQSFDAASDTIYYEPGFTEFIRTLFDAGYDVSDSSRLMQRIYRLRNKRPRTWYYPLTSRISERVLAIEQQSDDQYAPLVQGSIGFGAFALHSFVEDEESKLLIRSAAPADTWMNWLPYEIGADLRNGGLTVSWLPGVDLSEDASLDLKLTPYQLNRFTDDEIWFAQADLFLSYRREGVITSFGIGPTFTYVYNDWGDAERRNWGASVYLAMFQDKLRFTLGKRSRDADNFTGDATYFAVSITDIPGFVYWLSKGG